MTDVDVTRWALDRRIVTEVSFALNLIDSFSRKRPVGEVTVSVMDRDAKIVKNPSGYYVFLETTGNQYTVDVVSEFYVKEVVPVDIAALKLSNPKSPVKKVELNPLPSYPFPPGTTLIRGMVHDGAGNPVPGAGVEIAAKSMSTKTTERGEFVFYFKELTETDIKKVNGKRYLKGNPPTTTTIKLEAQKGLETGEGELKDVEECTAASLKDPIRLS